MVKIKLQGDTPLTRSLFFFPYQGSSCRLILTMESPPAFLKDQLYANDQPIFTCQHIDATCFFATLEKHNRGIVITKFLLTTFDQLYHLAASKGVQGILFKIPDGQANLLRLLEDAFSYWQYHLEENRKRTYLYLPTSALDYQDYVETSEDMMRDLDKVLGEGKTTYPSMWH